MKPLLAWLMMLCVWVALPARGFEAACHEACGSECAAVCAEHDTCGDDGHHEEESQHPCDGHHGCHCSCHALPLCAESMQAGGLVLIGSEAQRVRSERDRLPDEPCLGSEKPPLI